MTPIVLLCGESESGKDTLADLLCEKFSNPEKIALAKPIKEFLVYLFDFNLDKMNGPSQNRNEIDPRSIDSLFWDEARAKIDTVQTEIWLRSIGAHERFIELVAWFENLRNQYQGVGLSPRIALQTLGTNWARSFNPNIWINYAIGMAEKALSDGHHDVVILTDGRFPNEILKTAMVGGVVVRINALSKSQKEPHISENALAHVPNFWYDRLIFNDKISLQNLNNEAAELARFLKKDD